MSTDVTPDESWFARVRRTRAFRWGRDLLVMVALVVGVGAYQARDHVRGPAPAFSWSDRAGDTVTEASLVGKPTMLVFWAPWCTVCRAESGNISRVARMVGDRARVVSVASGYDDVSEVDRYVLDVGVDYEVVLGGDEGARAFRVRAFPTIYFLDDQGRIKGSVVGYTTTLGLLARLFV